MLTLFYFIILYLKYFKYFNKNISSLLFKSKSLIYYLNQTYFIIIIYCKTEKIIT